MLTDCQKVSQHLRRMILVGKPVPYRNACIFGKSLHNPLAVSTVLYAIEHSSQHAGRILDALLLSDLGTAGIQIGSPHSHVMGCYFERAACSGTGLFEDQRNIHASIMVN